jgi:hypothetical protein
MKGGMQLLNKLLPALSGLGDIRRLTSSRDAVGHWAYRENRQREGRWLLMAETE